MLNLLLTPRRPFFLINIFIFGKANSIKAYQHKMCMVTKTPWQNNKR